MKRGQLILVIVLGFTVVAASAYVLEWRQRPQRAHPMPNGNGAMPRSPAGVRVRVEVLNTTRIRGLARRATRVLRDQGFDVVNMGTSGLPRDTTLVLDRTGHPDWAVNIARILGPAARVESRPDTSRYLDITILLGSAWHAPSQPLDP